VSLSNDSLIDDNGTYLGLGATMFWAAWAYKNDMDKLKANLQFLKDNGFNYFRALGVVGCVNDPNKPSDYWAGREIKVSWPDYNEVIAGLTDLAYDQYGLRVEWTLIGDGQCTVPTTSDKWDLINRFLSMSVGREHKIVHFELANEYWQNGFGGADGLAELREMTLHMRDNTDILVAASAPPKADCASMSKVNEGCISDIATAHYARASLIPEGSWGPVWQPWNHLSCPLPTGSNNEPIGPGASVNPENSPIKLVSGAIVSYISSHALYVFHSSAGVRGDQDLWDMSGATSFSQLHNLLPSDLSSWSPVNADSADAPLQVFAVDASGTFHADKMWVDVNGPTSGAVRTFGAKKGDEFIVYPMGILNSLTMAPRKKMTFSVIDPISGVIKECHTKGTGQQFVLTGAEAFLIKGVYWCGDQPCNSHPCAEDPGPDDCSDCGPGFLCEGDQCVCPAPDYQEQNGACLPSCGVLSQAEGWGDGACCENGCAGSLQAPNSTFDCAYCCPSESGCVESAPNYTVSDCLVTPTNDTEICDDEGITVGGDGQMVLVCLGNQGGKLYVANHTGPVMSDGIPRCQGWEENGQNAWDYLNYIDSIVCDGTQEVLEVDLSNWVGEHIYVGVHDYPSVGAGHNTMACIAYNKHPGSGGAVTPAPPPAEPECVNEYTNEIEASVMATAVYVKINHPQYFYIDDLDPLTKRIKAYEMMTLVLNHLRAKGVNASRCVAHPEMQQSDPFYWCSDALVIGTPGNGTTVDVYFSWSDPGTPQTVVTEDGCQTGIVTSDLIPLP